VRALRIWMGIVGGIHNVVSRLGLHIYGVCVVVRAARPVTIGGMGSLCRGGVLSSGFLLVNRNDTFRRGHLKQCLVFLH
jgi:hypothetical protein